MALLFQGIVKFFSILANTKSIRDILDFSLKIYRANTKSSLNKTLLAKSITVTVFIFKYGMALLIITASLAVVRPCLSLIAFGTVETILPTHFQGINEEELVDYAILALYHTYICFAFVIGTAGCDLLLMVLVVHCYTMSKIFQNAIDEFNVLIKKHQRNTSNEELRLFLKNVILMHNDFVK